MKAVQIIKWSKKQDKTLISNEFWRMVYLFLGVMFLGNSLKAQKVVTIDQRKSVMPNEPSIYINPIRPSEVLAGSNIYNLYRSNNGGKKWRSSELQSSLGVWGDPVLFSDSSGNWYFSHLSKTPGKSHYEYIDRIVVQRSEDGKHFTDGVAVGYNGSKVQDKQWMSVDGHSRFKGRLYISWTEFDKYESEDPEDHSRIRFSYSTDGAESFSEAITISDTVGSCLDNDNTLEGATTAVAGDGTVLCAWAAFENIYLDRSEDGGLSWGDDQIIASQRKGWVMDIEQVYRSNGLPFLVSDQSHGKYHGRVYLLWGSEASGNPDIWLKYSDDAGKSWSQDIKVNDTPNSDTSDQFLAHLAVDDANGNLYAVYYDRRHSPSNLFMDVYVARSKDGGKNFDNTRLTRSSFAPPGIQIFFGDYNGIAARNGQIRPIWTASRQKGKGLKVCTALINEKDWVTETGEFALSTHVIGNQQNKKLILHYQMPGNTEHMNLKIRRRWKTVHSEQITTNEPEGEILIEDPAWFRSGKKYKVRLKSETGRTKAIIKHSIIPYPLAYYRRAIKDSK